MTATRSASSTPDRQSASVSPAVKAFSLVENALLIASVALLIAIPIFERIFRPFGFGITGATDFIQHLTLIIAMIGGSVAARENRLLAISTFSQFAPLRWKPCIKIFSHSIAIAISVALGVAGIQMIASERAADLSPIAYGIQKWALQLVIPFGFAAIAGRILWNVGHGWRSRIAALGGASLLLLLGGLLPRLSPESLESLWLPAMILLILAAFLGSPIFTALGGAALISFWAEQIPLAAVAVSQYSLTTESLAPAIPLFTLAGFVLAESKASERLVAVFQSLAGQFRAGPPLVAVFVCAFFTSFTGGSGVTILALGPLLLPLLLAAKCSEKNALGFLAGAGSLGILFPPSLPVILYFIVANSSGEGGLSLEKLFLGGAIPGFLMLGLLAFWGATRIPSVPREKARFSLRDAGRSLWVAKWELLLPVVALGSLFSGVFSTPAAAAAVTALYAIIIETVVHRDLSFTRDLPKVFVQCGLLVGGVLLILGVAYGFTNFLVDAEIPDKAVEWSVATFDSKWTFLLALNLLLILAGCLMDIYSAIVVIVPLLIPLGAKFGIDPVHLAILFLVNLELGYLTPPVGMNLFLAAYRFDKPILEVAKAALPVLAVFLIGVVLVTYLPVLTTFLPRLLE